MFRSVVKSVAKNTSIMMGQQVITWAANFFLMLFLARLLGPVEYGRLFLAASIVAIFRVIVEFGGTYLVAKDVARAHEHTGRIIVDQVAFRILIGVFSFAAMMVFVFLAGYAEPVVILIFLIGLGLLWRAGAMVLYASYQGNEKMQYTSLATIVECVFNSLVCVAALLLGAKAFAVAIISQVASFLGFMVMVFFAKRIVSSLPKVDWRRSFEQMKASVPYFLYVVFSAIYYRIDTIMLSKMAPEQTVGWYGAAYRLFDIQNVLPYILSIAVYPTLSRLWKDEKDTLRRTTQRSLELVILAGVPVTVGVITFAHNIIQLFYGIPEYLPSVIVLQILTAGLVLLYVDMALGTTLLAVDKQKQMSIVSLCAIPVNVGLNFVLINFFQTNYGNGGIGSAIATVLTELGIMISAISLLPKGILGGLRYSLIIKSVAGGLIMAACAVGLRAVFDAWVFIGLFSALIYLLALFAFRAFQEVETDLLLSMLDYKKMMAMVKRLASRTEPKS
jgi:O-antigen/teichoic acid export membrane protein